MNPDATTIVLLHALAKLFMISMTGYIAVRTGLIPVRTIEAVSKFITHISLPALILTTLSENLSPYLLGELTLGFIAALCLNILSLLLAYIFRSIVIPTGKKGRRLFLSLSAMQNSGYLPIPLVAAVLPGDLVPLGLLLTFVYMMVMGLIFWSAARWLIIEDTAESNWRSTLRNAINPPIAALFIGLIFLWTPARDAFNGTQVVRESFTLIGDTTIPLVMFVLGGSMGDRISGMKTLNRITVISAILKLIVIPALALLTVMILDLDRAFEFVLVLQAAMPAALNHIVIAREYRGNVPLTAGALFLHYSLSLVTIPFFLYLFQRLD